MSITAVGHKETIKMEYEIGLGVLEGEGPEAIMADTNSFTRGISLSEIKWGFYNSNEAGEGDTDMAVIEFTLHDIAGEALNVFLMIKSGAKIIYFKGPNSSGAIWGGAYAKYNPVQENCLIEFSQTQGFTYKFSGTPTGSLTGSKKIACHSKITICGLDAGNSRHGNTFADYAAELTSKWNSMLDNSGKAGTAQIEINFTDGASGILPSATPFLIERDQEGNPIVLSGHASSPIQQFEIPPGTSIAKALQSLWQTRFAGKEIAPGKGNNAGSILEVTLDKYDGAINHVNVKLHRKSETDKASPVMDICIGDDNNCKGATYRADLVGIDFNGLMTYLTTGVLNDMEGRMAEAAQAGNSANTKSPAEKAKIGDPGGHDKETSANLPQSPDFPLPNNGSFGGFQEFQAIINSGFTHDFALEVDMRYSYGFTPIVHGGLLKDAIAGHSTGAILYTEGAALKFFWYTTPKCDALQAVGPVSLTYRITSIMHTIGLSGNNTQVKLSHQNSSG